MLLNPLWKSDFPTDGALPQGGSAAGCSRRPERRPFVFGLGLRSGGITTDLL